MSGAVRAQPASLGERAGVTLVGLNLTAARGIHGGETRVGEQVFRWRPRDIFVAPSWTPVSHQAEDEAVLFSYSDRPVQEKLGLWREQRGNA